MKTIFIFLLTVSLHAQTKPDIIDSIRFSASRFPYPYCSINTNVTVKIKLPFVDCKDTSTYFDGYVDTLSIHGDRHIGFVYFCVPKEKLSDYMKTMPIYINKKLMDVVFYSMTAYTTNDPNNPGFHLDIYPHQDRGLSQDAHIEAVYKLEAIAKRYTKSGLSAKKDVSK